MQRERRITDPTHKIENIQSFERLLTYPEIFSGDKDFDEWIHY